MSRPDAASPVAFVSPTVPPGTERQTTVGGTAALERALRAEGASEAEIRFALAHKRAQSGDGNGRYTGADGTTDGSMCFGPMNLNLDMLRRHGLDRDATRLIGPVGDRDWRAVASTFLTVFRAEGREAFTRHVLDGYGGWRDTTAGYLGKLSAFGYTPDPPSVRPGRSAADRRVGPADDVPAGAIRDLVGPSSASAGFRAAPPRAASTGSPVPDLDAPGQDPVLAGNQRQFLAALQRQGATPAEIVDLMTIQLVESNDGLTHDRKKDHWTDGRRNFSPLNLNEAMLERANGPRDFTRLNRPSTPQQWDLVAEMALNCHRFEPRAAFFRHLRDGFGNGPDTTPDYFVGFAAQRQVLTTRGIGFRSDVHVPYLP